MHLFYEPNIAGGFLSEEESVHAVKVLRLKSGDEIRIVDGRGGFHKAVISLAHPKRCYFAVTESVFNDIKRDYRLHIGMAPTKSIERFEWFVEKAVEIGIDEITPILCRYSERKIIKPERLEKIVVSAAKQSFKVFMPVVNSLVAFHDFIAMPSSATKLIAHCYPQEKTGFAERIRDQREILLLIGPEGDFSEEEVQKAILSGFGPISLGDSRLRTETAGVVACTVAAFRNQY